MTTTSYAILGLLALRTWTTYELAVQMERTLNRIWPRARSKLYEEPKKLVAHGFARASKERTGKRPRTTYSITPKGRRALASWLSTPAAHTSLESEALVKLFFADHGTTADALATLDSMRQWALEQLEVFAEAAGSYVASDGPFPERAATNIIGARFMVDHYEMVLRWAEWAEQIVEKWPDDPSNAKPDMSLFDEIVDLVSSARAASQR